MLDDLTEAVIERIKQRYILVEKTFNLNQNESIEIERIFMENMADIICKYYEANKERFLNGAHLVNVYKKCAMCFVSMCRDLPEESISYGKIGHFLKKDHSSVIAIRRNWEKHMGKSFDFRIEFEMVKKQVEESLKL